MEITVREHHKLWLTLLVLATGYGYFTWDYYFPEALPPQSLALQQALAQPRQTAVPLATLTPWPWDKVCGLDLSYRLPEGDPLPSLQAQLPPADNLPQVITVAGLAREDAAVIVFYQGSKIVAFVPLPGQVPAGFNGCVDRQLQVLPGGQIQWLGLETSFFYGVNREPSLATHLIASAL